MTDPCPSEPGPIPDIAALDPEQPTAPDPLPPPPPPSPDREPDRELVPV